MNDGARNGVLDGRDASYSYGYMAQKPNLRCETRTYRYRLALSGAFQSCLVIVKKFQSWAGSAA